MKNLKLTEEEFSALLNIIKQFDRLKADNEGDIYLNSNHINKDIFKEADSYLLITKLDLEELQSIKNKLTTKKQ